MHARALGCGCGACLHDLQLVLKVPRAQNCVQRVTQSPARKAAHSQRVNSRRANSRATFRTCVITGSGTKALDCKQNVLEMGVDLVETIHAQNVTLFHASQRRPVRSRTC